MQPRYAVPLGSLVVLAILAGPSRSGDPEERKAFIDSAVKLAVKMDAIKPRPDEVRWLQIPWMLDLTAAAKASQSENRPLLIWASGDEPLERCWGYADELRAGSLSDPTIIQRVSRNFVPAAVNLYKVRKAEGPGGDLFRSVQKQKPQYQGIWIVSPEGKVLASLHDFKSDKDDQKIRETLAVIDRGLRAFGAVKPRPVAAGTDIPFRGVGFRPDGSVTLAAYVRAYDNGRPQPRPVQDSFNLSEKEFQELAPPKFKVGTQWDVPKEVAAKLARCLSPSSDQSTMPRPEEVTAVELRGRVRAVVENEAWVGFLGGIRASHLYEGKRNRGEAKIRGLASYNFQTKKMMFVSFVLEGTFRGRPPYDEPVPIAAVAQWVQKKE